MQKKTSTEFGLNSAGLARTKGLKEPTRIFKETGGIGIFFPLFCISVFRYNVYVRVVYI